MIAHQSRLEKTLREKTQKGGFVLDLVKAFNCIPRRPLMKMMLNPGVPEQIVTFLVSVIGQLKKITPIWSELGISCLVNKEGTW